MSAPFLQGNKKPGTPWGMPVGAGAGLDLQKQLGFDFAATVYPAELDAFGVVAKVQRAVRVVLGSGFASAGITGLGGEGFKALRGGIEISHLLLINGKAAADFNGHLALLGEPEVSIAAPVSGNFGELASVVERLNQLA